jgi:hypothetical protein
MVSPSNIECAGRTALARPSCATEAILETSLLFRSAVVATTPIVVLSALPLEGFRPPTPSAARSRRNCRELGVHARHPLSSHGSPVSGSTTDPLALTTASAPMTTEEYPCSAPPTRTTVLAVPTPPCKPPALAPVPAPTAPQLPCRVLAAAAARHPNEAFGRWPKLPPRPRSKITAVGTTGTTWVGVCSGGPTGKPLPCDSSHVITPSAAASPYALPPVRHTAWMRWMRFCGCNASVSRVPGPPPRTSTPGVAPAGAPTTVVPVCQPRLAR